MKIITIFLFIFLTINCFSQSIKVLKISKKDSISLNFFWKKFIKNIEYNKINNLCNQSYTYIKSDINENDKRNSCKSFWIKFLKHKFYKSIINKKYSIVKISCDYYKPILFYNKYYLKIFYYEIGICSMEPELYQKSSEGLSVIFRFIKSKNGFKFTELYSIP